jgi:hypothetical protein
MITLSMIEASMAQTLENAALLSPCHTQTTLLAAVLCGNKRSWIFFSFVLDLFFRPVTFFA